MTCGGPRRNATPSEHFLHTSLRSSHPALHTSHLHFISTHLIWSLLISLHVFQYVSQVLLDYFHFISSHLTETSFNSSQLFCTSEYYFVLQSLRRVLLSTTLYYKACANYFPVLLCTTTLAKSSSQYLFVLQSLHKARSSTTLYYKACTQYYFVLQSLHKVLPNTALYYKAWTKHFPVLLCTTKLLQNTFQYYFVIQSLHKARSIITVHYKACTQHYFVLQSLHKARSSTTLYYKACTRLVPVLLCTTKLAPSTTLYYKACTKHFPVLVCTTKLAQSTSQYYFVLQRLHPVLLRIAKLAQNTSQHYFVLQSLHEALSSTTLYYEACASTSQYYFVTRTLHKVRPSTTLYCTTKLLHTASFLNGEAFTHRSFYTQNLLHTASFYRKKLTQRRSFLVHNDNRNCSSKTGSDLDAKAKKDDFEALFKRTFKRKITSAKNEKICWQITVAALMQPLQYYLRDPAATFMQPLQCVSQHHVAKPHLSTHMATEHDNNHATIPMRSATRDSRNAKNYAHRNNMEQPLVAGHRGAWGATNSRMKRPQPHRPHTRGTFHRRLQSLYMEKHKVSCSGFLSKTKPMQQSCSHYNAFRGITWLTRISLRTWQQSMTTIMQPFQCDLQPEIQETQRTTHTGTTWNNHSLQNTEDQ